MNVIVSHSGKQHAYHVANALQNLGVLKKFYTSSYIGNRALQKVVNKADISYLKRRYLDGLGGKYVSSAWRYELPEILLRAAGAGSAKISNAVLTRDEKFDRHLSNKLRKCKFDAFWGFQGSCLNSLKAAAGMGKSAICEMTIAHLPFANRLLQEEARLQPEWAESIDFFNFPAIYEKRLIEEPEKASHVIAISEFLKYSLVESGIAQEKVTVIPLGFDPDSIRFDAAPRTISNRPLKILFAGRITQRKGMSYLLDAMAEINNADAELHIIGNIHGLGQKFNQYRHLYHYTPGISQHELFNKYTDYDALIFPSLLEGFGLVTVEAMGAGLPVITTPNTNAFELIRDNVNGYLVPIRDSNAIVEAIQRLRNLSDDQYNEMRYAARTAALAYTWSKHQELIGQFIDTLHQEH